MTFSSAIPIGSTITRIITGVNVYTGTPALGAPGQAQIEFSGGLAAVGVMYAWFTLSKVSTSYPIDVSGLNILVNANTFADGMKVQVLNKEAYYDSTHYVGIGGLTIEYTLPPRGSLFFGSNF